MPGKPGAPETPASSGAAAAPDEAEGRGGETPASLGTAAAPDEAEGRGGETPASSGALGEGSSCGG